jgi:predicted enzyme related to lactoylglutathione lyase
MNTKRNPVAWFEIYVQDMDRAKSFYEKTLGRTFENLPSPGLEMWAFSGGCDASGATGALCKKEGKDSGVGGTIVYFSCEDCGETETCAYNAGGKIHLSKMSIAEHGFISLVHDTEGNMIGLHSMK